MATKRKPQSTMTEKERAEEQINAYFGKKIREIRNIRGLSMETVAKHLGMDRTNLSHIEKGRNKITGVIIWELAMLFNCPVDQFFPKTSNEHSLSHSDIDLLKKEDAQIEEWAVACFPKKG